MGTNEGTSQPPLIPVFKGENFDFWKIKMITLFKSEGLWEIVDQGLPDVGEEVALREAREKDAKALSRIQHGLDDTIFPIIIAAESAKEAWITLQKEFEGSARVKTRMDKGKASASRKDDSASASPEYIGQLTEVGQDVGVQPLGGGRIPTQAEVDDIASALSQYFGQLTEVRQDGGVKPVGGIESLQTCFHRYQTDPSVQRTVRSITSDQAVWEAILKNPEVQELRRKNNAYYQRSNPTYLNGETTRIATGVTKMQTTTNPALTRIVPLLTQILRVLDVILMTTGVFVPMHPAVHTFMIVNKVAYVTMKCLGSDTDNSARASTSTTPVSSTQFSGPGTNTKPSFPTDATNNGTNTKPVFDTMDAATTAALVIGLLIQVVRVILGRGSSE